MPTPRQHGGAALEHIPLTVPGFKGLNTQASSSILGPEWATYMLNSVLDENNRVASRKGWDNVTTGGLPGTNQFVQLGEYRSGSTRHLIGTADNTRVYASTNDGVSWTAVDTGSELTNDNVQMVNFRGNMLLFQEGDTFLVYDGTSISDPAYTGAPTGGAAVAAFGRVWAVDSNGVDIKYCALLDHTDWSGSDTGTLSVENVWPDEDKIVALAAFNGALVAFGEENIVVWTDGRGSAIGMDPLQAYVVDTVSGVGCVARDSVANVKGDLWFLSKTGLQSLGRLIQEKSNPLDNLSKNIQDFLQEAINDPEGDLTTVRACYSPADKFYLLSMPKTRGSGASATEYGRAFVFDTRGKLEDGSVRVMGQWVSMVPRALVRRRNNEIFSALTDVPGDVGKYTGYTDNGNTYIFEYESGWIDITGTQGYLVIPKRIDGLFYLGQDSTINLKWAYDFSSIFKSRSVSYNDVAAFSEWGESEWGEAEWGGGTSLREARVAASGTGEFVKLGVNCTIGGGLVAVQQLDVFAKIGRLK